MHAADTVATHIAPLDNTEIAARLDEIATLLEDQRANQYRVQAWRAGAEAIRDLDRPASTILDAEGLEGLDRIPGIGPALARAISELLHTGRSATLARLRGETAPIAALMSVPGIGPRLAERIHDELGIESLEELEIAAHDGRLSRLGGFGEKRLAGVKDALATRLRSRHRARETDALPSVSELLDVDREYRRRAVADDLPKIAPRRFNPAGTRWLPVLHTTRGTRHYTALFSNTAAAHQFNRTHDWVVLYFDGQTGERQCTVVTAHRGPLDGHRVIRGRESECIAHYRMNVEHPRAHRAAG